MGCTEAVRRAAAEPIQTVSLLPRRYARAATTSTAQHVINCHEPSVAAETANGVTD